MAGDFDGSDFVGLDADITGDGQSDTSTRPLSTYVENRLDGNLRYLVQRGSRVARTFRSVDSSDNPGRKMIGDSSTVGRYTCHHQPIPLQPNLSEIECRIWGQVNLIGAETQEVRITLELVDLRTGERYSTNNDYAGSGAGTNDLITLTLDLSDDELSAGLADVNIWVDSRADNASGDVEDIDLENQFQINVDGTTNLVNDFAGSAMLRFSNGGSGETAIHHDSTNDGSGNVYLGQHNGQGLQNPDGEAVYKPYLSPQSIDFRYTYDDTSPTPRYTDKSAASMRAQQAVSGKDVSQHATNHDGIAARERMLAIGPDGDNIIDAAKPQNYRYFWRWHAKRIFPAAEEVQYHGDVLDKQTCRLPTTSGTVYVRGYLYGGFIGGDVRPRAPDVWQDETKLADLDVTAELTQGPLDTGTSVASVTSTVFEAQYYPLRPTTEFALPNTFYWGFFPFGGASNSDLSDRGHSFFDGQLKRNDFVLLTPFTVEIPYTGAARDVLTRMELTFDAIDIDIGNVVSQFEVATICTQTTWTHTPL